MKNQNKAKAEKDSSIREELIATVEEVRAQSKAKAQISNFDSWEEAWKSPVVKISVIGSSVFVFLFLGKYVVREVARFRKEWKLLKSTF